MDRDTSTTSLLPALAFFGFRFGADQFDPSQLLHEATPIGRRWRTGFRRLDEAMSSASGRVIIRLASTAGNVAGFTVELHPETFRIDAALDNDAVKQATRSLAADCFLVGTKFVLGQPVLIACVDGDLLSRSDRDAVIDKVDAAVQTLVQTSARLGPYRIRGSATGIVLFLFATSPGEGEVATLRKSKRQRFWTKTWTLPWVVLAEQESVFSHAGLPGMAGVLNAKDLKTQIFGP